MRRQAPPFLFACLCGAAVSSVRAFAPMSSLPGSSAAHHFSSALLRPGAGLQEPSGVPSLRSPKCAALRTAPVLCMGKTQLVTYGDLWRDALNENNDGEEGEFVVADETSSDGDDFTYAMEELSLQASEVVKPIKEVATGVASALWNKLSASPNDEEVQKNLKAFAKCHSGAVMTPLGDEELASEVRYLGMFPDLVDALLDAQEDDESEAGLRGQPLHAGARKEGMRDVVEPAVEQ